MNLKSRITQIQKKKKLNQDLKAKTKKKLRKPWHVISLTREGQNWINKNITSTRNPPERPELPPLNANKITKTSIKGIATVTLQ